MYKLISKKLKNVTRMDCYSWYTHVGTCGVVWSHKHGSLLSRDGLLGLSLRHHMGACGLFLFRKFDGAGFRPYLDTGHSDSQFEVVFLTIYPWCCPLLWHISGTLDLLYQIREFGLRHLMIASARNITTLNIFNHSVVSK